MTKTKRNPVLKKIAQMKDLSRTDIAKAANISAPTVTLYLRDPRMMNGIMRERFAKILSIDISMIDDIANGKIKSIQEIITI